ncbi:MAG: iron ABC transporter permease [Chloroflexota bacterium]
MPVRRPIALALLATVVCLCAALPLFYIGYHAFRAEPEIWGRLTTAQLPRLGRRTLLLLLYVCGTTAAIGILAAWLVERTDLPWRRFWRWLLVLPLAVPGYVMSVCYMFLLRRGGFIDRMAMTYLGFERQEFPLPPLFTVGGVAVVMSLYAFPLVYLAVAAALRVQDAALEDAARVLGRSGRQIFIGLTLRLIVPAITGGLLLVGLYVLSDFGTVALMRYQTFTTAIYRQFAGTIGRTAASIVSIGLLGLSLPLLLGENWLSRSERRYSRSAQWRPAPVMQLGSWRWLAIGYIVVLATLSIFVPLLVLSGLTIRGIVAPTEVDRIWSIGPGSLFASGSNSIVLAVAGATLVVVLGILPALLTVRYPSEYSRTLSWLSKTAFSLPGIIVGLGFLMFFIRTPIYATVAALGLALTFRLLPQTVALSEATLRTVSPTLEQAAHTLGAGQWNTLRRVTIPLAAPGLLAAWALAFVTAMKELPLLVILRPPGFDTLPVKVWEAANDSIYTQAAPPALLLVALTTVTLGIVYSVGRFGVDKVIED